MLSVCVSASSTDGAVITTAYYRSILGATSTGDDATQQALVVAASRWAEAYLRYPILAQTYGETLETHGDRDLVLSRRPIIAALRLFDDTSTGDATAYCSTDYDVDFDAGIYRRRSGGTWPLAAGVSYHLGPFIPPNSAPETWYAEYTAGWIVGGLATTDTLYSTAGIGGSTTTGETVPEAIKLAVALKAVAMGRAGGQMGVSSKKIGDLSITYGAGAAASSGGVTPESLLDLYRSVL